VIDFGGAGQHVILPAENLIGNLQWWNRSRLAVSCHPCLLSHSSHWNYWSPWCIFQMYADSVMAKTWQADQWRSVAWRHLYCWNDGLFRNTDQNGTKTLDSRTHHMEQPEWHPYTRSMTLRRFQQIRLCSTQTTTQKWLVLMTPCSKFVLFWIVWKGPFLPILMLMLALMRPVFLQGPNLAVFQFSSTQLNRVVSFTSLLPPMLRHRMHVCAYVCTQETCVIPDGYQAPTARVHPYTKSRNDCWAEETTGLDPDDQEGRSDSETLSETEQAVEEVPRTRGWCWICVLSLWYRSSREHGQLLH
jgi:hypothetical protein